MLWTDPLSLSASSPNACWNPILILRHEYEHCQKAIRDVHVNENVIKASTIVTFEILQQEKQNVEGE